MTGVLFVSFPLLFFVMRTSYTTKRFLSTPGYGASAFLSKGNVSLQMTTLYNRDGQGMFVALQNHG
jgi:hypothetical protein